VAEPLSPAITMKWGPENAPTPLNTPAPKIKPGAVTTGVAPVRATYAAPAPVSSKPMGATRTTEGHSHHQRATGGATAWPVRSRTFRRPLRIP
jgi:hypothetical protein